jgi:hypothetical protein
MTSSERRAHHRYKIHLAVEITAGDRKNRVGVSQDASVRGILLNTRSAFEPGQTIELRIHLPVTEDEAEVTGHVVRVESVEWTSPLPFKYLAAVEFDRPLFELEASLKSKIARESSAGPN